MLEKIDVVNLKFILYNKILDGTCMGAIETMTPRWMDILPSLSVVYPMNGPHSKETSKVNTLTLTERLNVW